MTRYNFSCGKFSKYFKALGLAIASLLLIFSPWITFLTASSTILPLFVLGISGTLIIIEGTCFTDDGINKRDQIVIENFYSKNTPLCGVLGGGYNKSFEKLIELHSMLHKNCAKII